MYCEFQLHRESKSYFTEHICKNLPEMEKREKSAFCQNCFIHHFCIFHAILWVNMIVKMINNMIYDLNSTEKLFQVAPTGS